MEASVLPEFPAVAGDLAVVSPQFGVITPNIPPIAPVVTVARVNVVPVLGEAWCGKRTGQNRETQDGESRRYRTFHRLPSLSFLGSNTARAGDAVSSCAPMVETCLVSEGSFAQVPASNAEAPLTE